MKATPLLLLLALPAIAQRPRFDTRRIAIPTPITRVIRRPAITTQQAQASAMLYVASPQGVTAYTAAGGVLTAGPVHAVTGNLVGATATDLITIDAENVYSYALAADGSIGSQNATAASQGFAGAECGPISSASVDPSGMVYVQLAGATDGQGDTICDAIQTYKAEGLVFEGATEYDPGRFAQPGPQPVVSGNFAYSTTAIGQACEQEIDTFAREKTGVLDAIASTVTDPQPDPAGGGFFPLLMAADSASHLAVAMMQDFDPPCGPMGDIQLASYTVKADGSLVSADTWVTMPAAGNGVEVMQFDSTGTLLAVAGDGLLLYHFGARITPDGENLLPGAGITALGWDSAGYLYAWGVDADGAYQVFTFSTADGAAARVGTTAAPASTAMVVVAK